MNIKATKENVEHIRQLHNEARRILCGDMEPTQMIARLSYTLGEMREPLNNLREALSPEEGGAG